MTSLFIQTTDFHASLVLEPGTERPSHLDIERNTGPSADRISLYSRVEFNQIAEIITQVQKASKNVRWGVSKILEKKQ